MGLLQLAPNGKAHLIPITILYDGEFYDASAYKAAPVPMALESGTVYEAVRSDTLTVDALFVCTTLLDTPADARYACASNVLCRVDFTFGVFVARWKIWVNGSE